jgi:hypothetical protein
MYPELDAVGGLGNVLKAEFKKLNSCLQLATASTLDSTPVPHSVIEKGKKFSQISLAAHEPLYLLDFWREGVCLAQGQTTQLANLANALDCWLCHDVTTAKLASAFAFVTPLAKAAAFEEHREIAYMWARIQADESRADLRAFVDLALRDVVLSKLFPFTSLSTLCFSRCTGYPYTCDTPTVTPRGRSLFGGWKYDVRLPSKELAGRGNAVKGTAADL